MATGAKKKQAGKKSTVNVSKKANTKKKQPVAETKNKVTTKKRITAEERQLIEQEEMFRKEVTAWSVLAISVILFASNLGFGGSLGNVLSNLCFAVFGLISYIVPFILFFGTVFLISNKKNTVAKLKVMSAVICMLCVSLFIELTAANAVDYNMRAAFTMGFREHKGGGAIAGMLAGVFYNSFGIVGAYVIDVIGIIISAVFLTERALFSGVQDHSTKLYRSAKNDVQKRTVDMREKKRIRQEYRREYRRENQRRMVQPQPAQYETGQRRMDKKVSGVIADTTLYPKNTISDDITPIDVGYMPMLAEPSKAKRPDVVKAPITRDNVITNQAWKKKEDNVVQISSSERMKLNAVELSKDIFEDNDPVKELRISLEPADILMEETLTKIDIQGAEFEANDNDMDEFEDISGNVVKALDIDMFDEADKTEVVTDTFDDVDSAEAITDMPADIDKAEVIADTFDGTDGIEISEDTTAQTDEEEVLADIPEINDDYGETADAEDMLAVPVVKDSEAIDKPVQAQAVAKKPYEFPPLDLLAPADPNAKGDSREHLMKTAQKLQQTLKTFGVNVTVTNVSCGPSVTRYEIQPEMGVKVSKIVGLTDDIKLNLAAADIRMEAPIPGKAAIGIEVPNKETVMVPFRELIESEEFINHKSKLAFVTGKDIAGKVVVADLAKMPHVLIAGSTGSGKSVCINTIIMSIIYKADPEDVKLIMVDPKVVELSVYNGIPHLLIPVVTDPKKAAGALAWATAEMDSRYEKFAEYGVRDIDGYNKKVETIKDVDDPDKPVKMPRIVVIVDELADLMMVAPGDVETYICRLAQLARAAGIHLIIATQRPSVNVITGLIKANMPSRIAFAVSSGVDSRTILDMNGAEKLLGKGDMLFYPQSYNKPRRVQGAFVSDNEVSNVVDFVKKENSAEYDLNIEEKMRTVAAAGKSSSGDSEEAIDNCFVEAGRFVIDKDKASVSMIQRRCHVGWNRAARIMEQLEEAGVVGPDEGAKPRKVLMSESEFDTYIEECV